MPQLIIGHTTHDSTTLWVQGDASARSCEITLTTDNGETILPRKWLPASEDFVATLPARNLLSGTYYRVSAKFLPAGEIVTGRFRTFPGPETNSGNIGFSFVLSSCNLSVVSVSNLIAQLLAAGGVAAGMSSLDIPAERWRPGFKWFQPVLKPVLKFGLMAVSGVVQMATQVKQPSPPALRSPFLKLTAVFDAVIVDIAVPVTDKKRRPPLPAAGDTVWSGNGPQEEPAGIVASAPECVDEETTTWRLVLTQMNGAFKRGDSIQGTVAGDDGPKVIPFGKVSYTCDADDWYERPAFFLHVGDQIYYDVPDKHRRPDRDEYKLAYKEAFFDDPHNRYLLANWPHYMILDDHEIVDQFPSPASSPYSAGQYLDAALPAYLTYVHGRNPGADTGRVSKDTGPLWYCFTKGNVRFFVLDTRTRRTATAIIDTDQMDALTDWLTSSPQSLKFVVTGVPFVAEIATDKRQLVEGQARDDEDKWSAARFAAQRHQIIDCIANNRIENVVFLTGDMHCCYHASMRIGRPAGDDAARPAKYNSIVVHELAGGPANQLQLAKIATFNVHTGARTANGTSYETFLDRFHTEVSAVMHLRIQYEMQTPATSATPITVPVIDWNVIRTLTDTGALAWRDPSGMAAHVIPDPTLPSPDGAGTCGVAATDEPPIPDFTRGQQEPVMCGRIVFVPQRSTGELIPWT